MNVTQGYVRLTRSWDPDRFNDERSATERYKGCRAKLKSLRGKRWIELIDSTDGKIRDFRAKKLIEWSRRLKILAERGRSSQEI